MNYFLLALTMLYCEFSFIAVVSSIPECKIFLWTLQVTAKLSGEPQKVDMIKEGVWQLSTRRLAPGTHTIVFNSYVINRGEKARISQGIQASESEKSRLLLELDQETDSEKRKELEDRISVLEARVLELKSQLVKMRKKVGKTISSTIIAQ